MHIRDVDYLIRFSKGGVEWLSQTGEEWQQERRSFRAMLPRGFAQSSIAYEKDFREPIQAPTL